MRLSALPRVRGLTVDQEAELRHALQHRRQ